MGGVAIANIGLGIPLIVLTSDPPAIAEAPFYLGAVTMLRTALLAGAGAVCLVTARIIRGRDGQLGELLTALGLFGAIRYGRLVLRLPEAGVLLFVFPSFVFAAVADTLSGPLFTPLLETTAELSGIVSLAFFGLRLSLSALHAAARRELV